MTRAEIEREYKVDERGIIRSPGKFEGEPVYAPHFWSVFLEGGADEDDGENLYFDVSTGEANEFSDWLADVQRVVLYEDEQGFVHVTEVR